MGVIVGSLTTVNIGGTDGFQSVNWNIQVQSNRLWELGSWNVYKTQVTKTITVSVTTYAGVLGTVNLTPSTSCANSSAKKNISIQATACGGGGSVNFNESDMFITSYSYSKGDPTAFGTESWSFQKWVDPGNLGADYIEVGAPTYVLQGTSEGSATGNVSNLGVTINGATSLTGSQGSVSAGFPGLGNADDIEYGIITRIGGGTLEQSGKTGQSNASVPHQPLYLG